ncbi:uncharacterized protein LOC135499843 [Lineus longissimus]|uniref:uncharacterized protein LOC135499843 n=1 Tax=Lineus longissimus TaxID=88925 RepID=UPI00315D62A2
MDKLLSQLKGKIGPEDVDKLKDCIRNTKTVHPSYRDTLEKSSTFEEVWHLLEMRQIIWPGNYDFLNGMFKAIGRRDLVLDNEERERELKMYSQSRPVSMADALYDQDADTSRKSSSTRSTIDNPLKYQDAANTPTNELSMSPNKSTMVEALNYKDGADMSTKSSSLRSSMGDAINYQDDADTSRKSCSRRSTVDNASRFKSVPVYSKKSLTVRPMAMAVVLRHLEEKISPSDLHNLKAVILESIALFPDFLQQFTLEEVWQLYERLTGIRPENYDHLKTMLRAIRRPDLVDDIEAFEEIIPMNHGCLAQPLIDIGKYAKSRCLGHGSFGSVHLFVLKAGNDDTFERVAVKEKQIDRRRGFYTEVEMLGKLNHPNIVQFLGCQDDGMKLLIFFEYMSGESIAQRLAEGPLTEDQTRKYTRDILKGLEYIHSQGVIHRNINGNNILFNSFNTAKLAGFAMSIEICPLTSVPYREKFVRTIPFMAPEVVTSDERQLEYGTKLDIWSVGCTVVQMLTTKPPWDYIDYPTKILFKICSGVYPEYKLPSDVSKGARYFIKKCFTQNPKERPTASELLFDDFLKEEFGEHDKGTKQQKLVHVGLPRLRLRDEEEEDTDQDEELAKPVTESGEGTMQDKLVHAKLPSALPVQDYKETRHDREQPVKPYRMTFTLDQPFNEDLNNEESEAYKQLKQQILDKLLREAFGDDFKKISLLKFEEGSIKAVLVIELAGDEDIEDVKEKLRRVEDDVRGSMQLVESSLTITEVFVSWWQSEDSDWTNFWC